MIADPVADVHTNRSYLAPIGFATTVSMWAVAYVCRLPGVMAPPSILLFLMLTTVAFWGWYAARHTGRGGVAGIGIGFVSSILNMLILGSLLTSSQSHEVIPSALWWIPGSVLATCVLGGLGALAAGRSTTEAPDHDTWTALLANVAAAATFLLVIAGGLVTSQEAGLAVVDWPNSFGYSMFLYPLSRMTGGIYYEHAHRLFGSLVGLTTIALAITLLRFEARRWVRRIAYAAVACVLVQGLLGGLRVTGRLTLSTEATDMAPQIGLAVVHGVFGQLFLGLMILLAVVTSVGWSRASTLPADRATATDRSLQGWLLTALTLQLLLGALHRHLTWGLVLHVTLAAVVTMLAVVVGARIWGLRPGVWPLQRLGQALAGVVSVQVTLGIATLAVTGGQAVVGDPSPIEVMMATAHQAGGALLLGIVVALTLWTRRLTSVE
ncbi:MAG: hypothetical protein GY906_02275 [bacterium]|nr:hypothetical protein [bacterium]